MFQTEKLMTSQIRSCVEYIIPNFIIIVLLLHSYWIRKLALLVSFNTSFTYKSLVAYFLGPPYSGEVLHRTLYARVSLCSDTAHRYRMSIYSRFHIQSRVRSSQRKLSRRYATVYLSGSSISESCSLRRKL